MAFTYFFRDLQTLEIVVELLIPQIAGRQKIAVWDAGCASGQEPYTLAILLAEKMNSYSFRNLQIYATDIDGSNLFGTIIEGGIYPYSELERIPRNLFEKYFRKYDDSNNWQIDISLRSKITYIRENLITNESPTDQASLIICKNVLLHLSKEEKVIVLEKFHKSLLPGGLIAMENTETIPSELQSRFVRLVNNAQIYRRA